MKYFTVEGIIIKRRDFGEADRFLTLFTNKYGKIKLLAKGVRRIHSRRGPNIELFNRAIFFVHKGRTFDILTEVQVLHTYEHMRKNLELIWLAYYICELVDGLCAEYQSHTRVYELLVETLNNLDHGLIQKFEMILLSELGFLPNQKFSENLNTTSFIEQILERKIRTKKLLTKLL